MDVTVKYKDLAERRKVVAEQQDKGYELRNDNFDADWKPGTEAHGTLIFTDQLTPPPPTYKDAEMLVAELMARVEKLEAAEVARRATPNP